MSRESIKRSYWKLFLILFYVLYKQKHIRPIKTTYSALIYDFYLKILISASSLQYMCLRPNYLHEVPLDLGVVSLKAPRQSLTKDFRNRHKSHFISSVYFNHKTLRDKPSIEWTFFIHVGYNVIAITLEEISLHIRNPTFSEYLFCWDPQECFLSHFSTPAS